MACWYEKASVVKGHHIYKSAWTPVICKELHTKLKMDNNTVAVILDGAQ